MSKSTPRAPGGGRKPLGEFARLGRPISVRMPEEMRKDLERAAAESGRSVTQELLRRVQNSFYRDRERERDPALYALLFMIGQLAEHIAQTADLRGLIPAKHRAALGSRWRTDRFLFKAFKFAVPYLLNQLDEPSGKLESPVTPNDIKRQSDSFAEDHNPKLARLAKKQIKSPEAYGEIEIINLWSRANRPDDVNELTLQQIKEELPQIASAWKREMYGLAQARRALELTPKPNSKL